MKEPGSADPALHYAVKIRRFCEGVILNLAAALITLEKTSSRCDKMTVESFSCFVIDVGGGGSL